MRIFLKMKKSDFFLSYRLNYYVLCGLIWQVFNENTLCNYHPGKTMLIVDKTPYA